MQGQKGVCDTLESIKMALPEASVNKVGHWRADDSRSEIAVFLTTGPIDDLLSLIDKGEELGLIVGVERPVGEVFGNEPRELDRVVTEEVRTVSVAPDVLVTHT